MADEVDAGDSANETQRPSKRDRFLDALSRRSTKWKKADKKAESNAKLSDDVENFLSTGRTSTSTSDSVPYLTSTPSTKRENPSTGRKETSNKDVDDFLRTGRPTTADSLPPHPSPRKFVVPKIDVSRSQRWPSQQVVESDRSTAMLRPVLQQVRSHSQGAMPRRGQKSRNLSVSFLEAPPTVIGEGGDEAEAPPNEISRRARARSVSPMLNRPDDAHGPGRSPPVKRKPVPSPSENRPAPAAQLDFVPQPPPRIATGFSPMTPIAQTPADIEFAMSLQPASGAVSPEKGLLSAFQPKPTSDNSQTLYRPSVPMSNSNPDPNLDPTPNQEPYQTHHLKPGLARQDLRMQFEEGQTLRHSYIRDTSNTNNSGAIIVDPQSFQKLSIRETGPAFDENASGDDIFSPSTVSDHSRQATQASGPEKGNVPGGWI